MESLIPILLASDFPMLRESMAKLLDNARDMQVVACAESETDVLSLATAHQPRIAVLDLNVEWDGLRDLVSGLFTQKVPVLLMSDTIDECKTFELVQRGLSGIIPRRIIPEMLDKSVRAVASGEIWISRRVVAQLVQQFRTSPEKDSPGSILTAPKAADDLVAASKATAALMVPMPAAQTLAGTQTQLTGSRRPDPRRFGLTARELQMVQALGEGMTNKDIATTFGISEYTVKHHLTKIFDKVGVYSRLELAMAATHHGLVGTTDLLGV